jgi:hypothetical protein
MWYIYFIFNLFYKKWKQIFDLKLNIGTLLYLKGTSMNLEVILMYFYKIPVKEAKAEEALPQSAIGYS